MVAVAQQDGMDRLHEAYRSFERTQRVRQAKIGYLLAISLVPLAVSLDYFVYPELLVPILNSRLICDAVLLPCFVLLFTPLGLRYIGFLNCLWHVCPMLIICWMIYASEGALSPYYAGLNLVMLAVCLLASYTLRQAAIFCAATMFCYGVACYAYRVHPPAALVHRDVLRTASTLFNNLYFLTATSVVVVSASSYIWTRRFEDFRLRHELDENNQQLASTLKKLKETEVQLVQSEKMNALGKLSAGLLHEINNPLNFTFMALQIAEQEAGENESLKSTLSDIEQGMGRIKSVISDLRGFAYPSKLQNPEPFAIEEALVSALRLVAHELGEIPVDRPEPPAEKVFGVKSQIVHVFMNLIINSAHALKARDLGRPPRIGIAWEMAGERLKVSVRDNGTGVAPVNLPRLFEPFFTTKDVGQGTGLGLSICHTIVQNHGGAISVASQEGQWTQVSFDLPLATTGSFV